MKKFILPIFIILAFFLFKSPAVAKEPWEVKLDCAKISSTLNFKQGETNSCFTYGDDDVKVSTMKVRLGGTINVGLPEDFPYPDAPSQGIKADKTEDLPIGDGGKIFYSGPPWGEGAYPYIEYYAKLGLCEMRLTGWSYDDYQTEGFKVRLDYPAAVNYTKEKLSAAAREIEGQIAAECGAKNVINSSNVSKVEQQYCSSDNSPQSITDWITNNLGPLDFEKIDKEITDQKLYGRTPQMTEEIIKKAQEDWEKMVNQTGSRDNSSPFRADIIRGQVQIKPPGQDEWVELKSGDKIPSGSTIFTGMDSTTVLSIRDKGVVQVLSFTEITVSEQGLEQAAKEKKTTTDITLQKGEIEVIIERGIYPINSPLHINTVLASNCVRGTHFWLRHEKEKNTDTLGVYEGKVEVKTKDGEVFTVEPEGGKPGIFIVVRKLSVIKLALAGLVLIMLIVGVAFFLKRRGKRTIKVKKRK